MTTTFAGPAGAERTGKTMTDYKTNMADRPATEKEELSPSFRHFNQRSRAAETRERVREQNGQDQNRQAGIF